MENSENNNEVSTVENDSTNQKKSNSGSIIVIVLAAIILLGGVFLTSKKSTLVSNTNEEVLSESNSTEENIETSEAEKTESVTADQSSKVVEIEAGSFYYKPNEIRVKKGETVKIVFKSVDMMHDFNIDELNVKMPIVKSGNSGEVTFTPQEIGLFEYYCSVGQHRKMGQVGKLIVE